ncbi:MAG: hypothetical protein B9J98_07645 [Candidatus Terraquivivens tikiterensis]|uniref:Uncharacterized protein n=1 Tax=Candidatus Terraquivivens tikiterensis TaxID=1980982 RepID=A0A2R7Y2R5_9ARCH|nr:MAG: hypothetical protein B9J98_07645 [Candidatus Terraquivivens tikiterensis]
MSRHLVIISNFKRMRGTTIKTERKQSSMKKPQMITYHEVMAGVKRLRGKKEENLFRRLFSMMKLLEYM